MIKQILIKQLFKGIFINKNVFLCETMPFCQKKRKIERKINQIKLYSWGGAQYVTNLSEFCFY